MINRRQFLTGSTAGIALVVAGCSGPAQVPTAPVTPGETAAVPDHRHQVRAATPAGDLVLPAGDALAVSRSLLGAATLVVVVPADAAAAASPEATPTATPSPSPSPTPSPAATTADTTATPGASATPAPTAASPEAGAGVARELGVPLLVEGPELAAELDRLQTRTVISYVPDLSVGERTVVPGPASAAELDLEDLPVVTAEPAGVLALAWGDLSTPELVTLAAAGIAEPTALIAPHPGADGASTAAVRDHTGPVVAFGDGFGTDAQFSGQVAVTRYAAEFPGGGVAPFPARRMIALYGHPETPALGMMGEQPPAQAVERLNRLVAEYRELLPDDNVMGAFEIIGTVASAAAGEQGDYSYRTPIATLLPWVEAAEANDLYVVLDLQPGRTDFLTQAKEYSELLLHPHVGLALDPEWRLKPDQRHLRQVGQVGVDEINEVTAWLADFIAENQLPPKVLTLHQFQTRMIVDRERLDVSRPEVQHLMHVDGQGGQAAKQSTWQVLQRDLPAHTVLGWKNFEDEDVPMLTPAQTVAQVHPTPHFISYQ